MIDDDYQPSKYKPNSFLKRRKNQNLPELTLGRKSSSKNEYDIYSQDEEEEKIAIEDPGQTKIT